MRKKTLLFMMCLSSLTFGQTNHQVDAQAMSWSPNDLTIEVGDSVTWINNNNGTHNVNGTTATYPSNPESFSMLTSGSNWTFGKRFNVPGIYMYRCDIHSSMMTGKVTVVDPSLGLDNIQTASGIIFGPNPAGDQITIQANTTDFTVSIYDMVGHCMISQRMVGQTHLSVASLNPGTYLVEINVEGKRVLERLMKN